MAEREREGAPLAVAEIPLLFELGLEERFDATVLVDAPEGERLRRLTELRGLDEREARAIMRSQMRPELKRSRADYVIDNGGGREELADRAEFVLAELRRRVRPSRENDL
jgi:dephospho-CoA kinase